MLKSDNLENQGLNSFRNLSVGGAVLFAVLNLKLLIQNGERTIVDDTAWNILA